MHRAQVLIEDWQYEALKSIAAREGRSISMLLREVLSHHLRGEHPGRSLNAIEGMGDDPHASGREHDRFLYGTEQQS
jgi:plasmid stability protein